MNEMSEVDDPTYEQDFTGEEGQENHLTTSESVLDQLKTIEGSKKSILLEIQKKIGYTLECHKREIKFCSSAFSQMQFIIVRALIFLREIHFMFGT